jgi:predicted transposase YbfD/YdcC
MHITHGQKVSALSNPIITYTADINTKKNNVTEDNMVCSDSLHEGNHMTLMKEVAKKEDFIGGISDGLEDFIKGRCKHFKDDEELEAYLMSL